jgi:hypothetical protein
MKLSDRFTTIEGDSNQSRISSTVSTAPSLACTERKSRTISGSSELVRHGLSVTKNHEAQTIKEAIEAVENDEVRPQRKSTRKLKPNNQQRCRTMSNCVRKNNTEDIDSDDLFGNEMRILFDCDTFTNSLSTVMKISELNSNKNVPT